MTPTHVDHSQRETTNIDYIYVPDSDEEEEEERQAAELPVSFWSFHIFHFTKHWLHSPTRGPKKTYHS